jgi:hypothetical protein
VTIVNSYPLPPVVQKYAKLVWGIVGFLTLVLTTIVNNYANVMSQGWLAVIQLVISVLGLAGLAVQSNAIDPATIVALVEKFLPNHTLVEKASFVPLPAPPVATPPLAAPEPPVQAPVAVVAPVPTPAPPVALVAPAELVTPPLLA